MNVHDFDPGPVNEPFASLARNYPGADVYPADSFRVEWGPIFHRGRLDGTARLLVIGQDPAAHECICRRILVGLAGRRTQGFLAKLGLTRGYVMINAFVYCQLHGDESRFVGQPEIAGYRRAWIDAILHTSSVHAVVALGETAELAWQDYLQSVSEPENLPIYRKIT